MLHDVLENQPLLTPIQTQPYVLYRRRWFMLFIVVMFNISNAMVNIVIINLIVKYCPRFALLINVQQNLKGGTFNLALIYLSHYINVIMVKMHNLK